MRFFNPNDRVLIKNRRLPHWAQEGTVVFITWRTHDSMPKEVLAAWRTERNHWLAGHGIDPTVPGWKSCVQELPAGEMIEYHDHFTTRWHDELDAGHGACALKQPATSTIVSESLRHFDGDRYELFGFVVMPNHVHLLVSFPDRKAMLAQCESWKHFTSTRINRHLGNTGRFWQQDAFDHLVRHESQFERLLAYMAENPMKAGLKVGEYVLWERRVDDGGGAGFVQ